MVDLSSLFACLHIWASHFNTFSLRIESLTKNYGRRMLLLAENLNLLRLTNVWLTFLCKSFHQLITFFSGESKCSKFQMKDVVFSVIERIWCASAIERICCAFCYGSEMWDLIYFNFHERKISCNDFFWTWVVYLGSLFYRRMLLEMLLWVSVAILDIIFGRYAYVYKRKLSLFLVLCMHASYAHVNTFPMNGCHGVPQFFNFLWFSFQPDPIYTHIHICMHTNPCGVELPFLVKPWAVETKILAKGNIWICNVNNSS